MNDWIVVGKISDMLTTISLKVNGDVHHLENVDPDTPLLWVLRDTLGLTGTKYGCGISMCGACTVHLDGEAIRSCITTVEEVGDSPQQIVVKIVPSEQPPGGVGEVGVPTFAPALCNAIFAATGKRIRRLPLTRHDLSW